MTRDVRLVLVLALGLLLGGFSSFSFAAAVPLRTPANVGGTGGSYVSAGPFAANNGQFSSGLTGNVGGRPFVAPATWRMASNAGQFAAGALRVTPAAIFAGVLLPWLAQAGLEWLNGEVVEDVTPDPTAVTYLWVSVYGHYVTVGNMKSYADSAMPDWAPFGQPTIRTSDGKYVVYSQQNSNINVTFAKVGTGTCPAGSTRNGETCVPSPSYQPADQADWDRLAALPLPDAVANHMSGKGVTLPLNDPVVDTTPLIVPLTDPAVNPVSGDTTRQVAVVKPQADGKTAEVQIVEQEVDPATGEPAVDPATGDPVKPTEPEDFCIKNPDALACWQAGEPEDAELDTDQKDIAISPDSGWGASGATCPADLTYTLHQGTQIKMKWQPLCQMADTFRPIVIGMAWLSSILIFMGIARRAA